MHKVILASILLLVLVGLVPLPCHGGSGGEETLITIDGTPYTSGDFLVWWENRRQDETTPFPETPDPFVDWLLLFREAERMQLYQDPAYRKKVLTFLKARTLMLLKAEEVDSRIVISEQALRNRYRRDYVPRYLVNILFFRSRESADRLLAALGPGPVDGEKLRRLAAGGDAPFTLQSGWYRPGGIDPQWRRVLDGLGQGRMSGPVAWKKGVVVLHCQEVRTGDEEDFAEIRAQVRRVLWKEEERRLTIALLRELRRKYHVRVDRERLQRLDISRPDDDFSDQPLIETDGGVVTERQFMLQVRRMQRFRRRNGFREDTSDAFREQILNAIIDQTLTSWEALARHYEKKPPFAATYTYYCRHRMIRSLEERIFQDRTGIQPDDVRRYYREHRQEFTRPEIIRMAIVEGSEEEMNELWTEVAMGGDFLALARQRLGHAPLVRDIPVDHLQPRVRQVAAGLTRGELSPVFSVNGHVSLLLLVDRTPARLQPLAEVGEQIRRRLRKQRRAAARKDFLVRLRARSSIGINSEAWRRLRATAADGRRAGEEEQTSQ